MDQGSKRERVERELQEQMRKAAEHRAARERLADEFPNSANPDFAELESVVESLRVATERIAELRRQIESLTPFQELERQLEEEMEQAEQARKLLKKAQQDLNGYPGAAARRSPYDREDPALTFLSARDNAEAWVQHLTERIGHLRILIVRRVTNVDPEPPAEPEPGSGLELVPDSESGPDPVEKTVLPAGSYDDGHHFGWKERTKTSPQRDEAIEHIMESLDVKPAAPAIPSDAHSNAGPAGPKRGSRGVMIAAGVLLLALSGLALQTTVFAPSARPSSAATATTGANAGATATTAAAVACANLAAEDLTFTGLPGASGPTHVTSDCGVVVSSASQRCRVVIGTADSRGVRNPSLWDERIGFDLGANHIDVFFQASWYEPAPYVIAVPGQGLFAGAGGLPRGGTAEIKMYGGPRGAPTTFGWTAESGSITFNTEGDAQHPAGGGTVDMQMKGGAGSAPIHITGTWRAEQPCATQ